MAVDKNAIKKINTSTKLIFFINKHPSSVVFETHFFGFGTLVNILWGSMVALACEALACAVGGLA